MLYDDSHMPLRLRGALDRLRALLALRAACPQCLNAAASATGPCHACRAQRLDAQVDGDVISLGGYGGGLGRLVMAAKFAGADGALDHLCAPLAEALRERRRRDPSLAALPLVPIPSHERRRRARGGDPVRRLAQGIAARADGHRLVEALRRTRADPPQSSRRRDERSQNVTEAFTLRSPWGVALRGRRVVLVDDVLTTGATARAAATALSGAGIEVALLLVVAGPGMAPPRTVAASGGDVAALRPTPARTTGR